MYKDFQHLFFLSPLAFSRTTGAAGILNHHFLSLLDHFFVLAFRVDEHLVKSSKKVRRIMYLKVKNAETSVETLKTTQITIRLLVRRWTKVKHEI
ncbi:hypothetical protein H5410_024680 [Solanum commersonii]|uniref:Uncharacterized protein n=1 Tax=Solanum commersonii TaxID=4109 RepID=A0A9J5ZMS4_SOLCO|nr:hypothetical protein H5410_024680 [Solanum commersonii]